MIIPRHFGYPTFSIPETRLPELQLAEPDIFEEPENENFKKPKRNPKILSSNNEEELDVSNQNLMLKNDY